MIKKNIYILWWSKDSDDNCGCWYDDMKMKVFNTKREAVEAMYKMSHKTGLYCGVVRKEIMV